MGRELDDLFCLLGTLGVEKERHSADRPITML